MGARRVKHVGEGTGQGSPSSDTVSLYKVQEITGFFPLVSPKYLQNISSNSYRIAI